MPTKKDARHQHAQYYMRRLENISTRYLQGGEAPSLAVRDFDQELDQIRKGEMWSLAQADNDQDAALLCNAYPYVGQAILHQRQDPREMLRWLEPALAIAKRTGHSEAEISHLSSLGVVYNALESVLKFKFV